MIITDEEMAELAGIDKKCRLIKGQIFLWKGGQTRNDLWDEDGALLLTSSNSGRRKEPSANRVP